MIAVLLLCAVTVLALVIIKRRRARRRQRQLAIGERRVTRTVTGSHVTYVTEDLVSAGAKVTYTTDRHYDISKILAAKRRAERRQDEMRQIAAQQGQPGAVAKFRRRG